MKKIITLAALIFTFSIAAAAQKSNDAITKRIKELNAEKSIALTYDDGAKTSKMMVVTGNFGDSEAQNFGLQAMNFALAFYYQGQTLAAAPDEIMLTFWVLTKKPQFAESHALKFIAGKETIDLGEARYAAKPNQNMEYLNFKIAPADLALIARAPNVKINLGAGVFMLTAEQRKTLADLVEIIGAKAD